MRFILVALVVGLQISLAFADDHGPLVLGLPVPPVGRPPIMGLPIPPAEIPLPLKCFSSDEKRIYFTKGSISEERRVFAIIGNLKVPCKQIYVSETASHSLRCESSNDRQSNTIVLEKGINGKYSATWVAAFHPHFPPGAMGLPARPIITKFEGCRKDIIMGFPTFPRNEE